MSSLRGLALFCGMCFVTLGWANSMGHVPPQIKEDIQKLKDLRLVHGNDGLFGKPVFLMKPDIFNSSLEEGEKKLLMREMLEVSIEIMSNLMNRTQEEKVKTIILAARGRVVELRDKYFADKEHILRTRLQDLWDIKTHKFETQRKAVYELTDLYSKANKLGSEIHEKTKKRRRRQVLRRKRAQLL